MARFLAFEVLPLDLFINAWHWFLRTHCRDIKTMSRQERHAVNSSFLRAKEALKAQYWCDGNIASSRGWHKSYNRDTATVVAAFAGHLTQLRVPEGFTVVAQPPFVI